MVIASKLLWSILCIHVFWFYFFITGTLVRVKSSPARPGHAKARGRNHMAELVITSTTGMAITGFVLLLLGFVGLLHYGAVLVWLALEALLFKIFKQENVFGSAFWLTRLRVIKRAWSLPARIIYLVFLLISIPAILPPTLWDSISYHLAYAVDWANAGRIYVDEFLRFPYYANNFVLIYALMFVVKAGYLCHFTTWLCGLLSCLGIYTLIEEEATNQSSQWFRFIDNAKNTILPLTLALSPLFLMFVDVGYVDVPIGLFILVPVLCTYLILKGNTANYDIDLIFTSAFCVGMKISLFLCLPLFVCSLFLVLRWQRKRRSRVLVLSVLLILLSAPWYLRNFVLAGDPITPVLNLKFRGRDPIFTQVLLNNFWFALGTIPTSIALAMLMAAWVNGALPGRALVRLAYFTPTVLPMIAVANLWLYFYTPQIGLLDKVTALFGAGSHNWLGNPDTVMGCLVAMTIWKEAGFFMIFYLAALQALPPELGEAARIEGASRWYFFRRVTFPLLMPTTLFVLVNATINSFKLVDHLFILTKGGPDNASNLLLYYIYQTAFSFFDTSYAATLTVVLLALLGAFALVQFQLIERRVHYR